MTAFGQTAVPVGTPPASECPPAFSHEEQIRIVDAAELFDYETGAVLGVVEGFTEYLPVSSTGHLIIANTLLGLEEDYAVRGKDGELIMVVDKKPLPVRLREKIFPADGTPAGPVEVPFTLKNAADAYTIVIQFGAILAVLFAYWSRVEGLIFGVLARRSDSLLLARNLIVAFLPAAIIGFIFNKIIEDVLFGIWPVIIALFAGALVMLWVEKKHSKLSAAALEKSAGTDLHQMSVRQSLGIGVAQCCALWPGTSRSMATICGGYLVGLTPARATEFSFLLGLITLTAAGCYKMLTSGKLLMNTFDAGPSALGLALAAITAFISVKWMVGWISRHGLALFAWYRIALAILLTLFFASGL